MTPAQMADIHRAAFGSTAAWDADAIIGMLRNRQTNALHTRDAGFALTRTIAPESELLTIAVHPAHQRQGIARGLMQRWLDGPGITHAFLEVAADNEGAIALYRALGFRQTGLRKGYYGRPGGLAIDALTMTKSLTTGQNKT